MSTTNFNFERLCLSLKEIFEVKTDTELAEALKMSRSAFASRKSKGSIPYENIIAVLLEHDVDLNELFRGQISLSDRPSKSPAPTQSKHDDWQALAKLDQHDEPFEPATVVPPVMQLGMRASFEMQDLAEQCGEPRESVSLSDVEYTAHDAIEVCQEQGQPLDRFFMPMFKSIARAGFRRTQRLKADLAAKRAKRQDDESGE